MFNLKSLTLAVLTFGLLNVQASGQERVKGADLFIDMPQYIGKQVILTDAELFAAHIDYALIRAGGVYFYMNTVGIDKESFRYFLANCSGIANTCALPLLVTPTGFVRNDQPILTSVKIAK